MRKITKFFVSAFAFVALALPMLLTACTEGNKPTGGGDDDNKNQVEFVDYLSQVTLDFSSNTKKQEVKVRLFVDGDTTHFDPVASSTIATNPSSDFAGTQGYIKARYLAINTPESTGSIEPWGKRASNFTRGKLENAQTIIVESDDDKWNIDSTGERYTLWIWYLPKGETEYKNLNIEILQEGLALGSSANNNRYGKYALGAVTQARSLKLIVHSDEKDPDFPYGSATPVTLKELRCHLEDYNGKKVSVEGVVTSEFNNSVYIEDFDAGAGIYFGMSVYYGYQTGSIRKVLTVGNRVRVVGVVTYFEGGGTYQISGVSNNAFDPTLEDNTVVIGTGESAFMKHDAHDIMKGQLTVTFEKKVKGEDDQVEITTEKVEIDYGEAVMSTTVTVENLTVKSIYTTSNGGNSDGAMSITCQAADGTTIVVRTEVLKDDDGNLITAAKYTGKTITVKGVVDKYDEQYQVKCYRTDFITILN